MTDPVQRANDLELRMAQAGGPDALIAGLVKGMKDLRLALKLTILGLLLDFALTVVAGYLYLRADTNQHAIEHNQHAITVNVKSQRLSNWTVCEQLRVNTAKLNAADATLALSAPECGARPTS